MSPTATRIATPSVFSNTLGSLSTLSTVSTFFEHRPSRPSCRAGFVQAYRNTHALQAGSLPKGVESPE